MNLNLKVLFTFGNEKKQLLVANNFVSDFESQEDNITNEYKRGVYQLNRNIFTEVMNLFLIGGASSIFLLFENG